LWSFLNYKLPELDWLDPSKHFSNTNGLNLKSALADILAAMLTCKQSAVAFKVIVLWLCNQHLYTRDVIGIKMTNRDLLYYEGVKAKTCREYKFHKNKHKNHANLEKWSSP